MVRIAVSSGFDLETVGACTSFGNERCVCATRAWMSCSAKSTLRDMSKVAVMRPLPERACDASDCTPSTCDKACSIGSMIWRSTDEGDAPGHDSETVILGLSTSGYWLTPTRVSAT